MRTDVILNLPGGRHLVIDSKVSLTAYADCAGATEDEPRRAALKLHLASVRGHIAGLAKAGYHRLPGVEAPDFIVMFVPIEPAFLLALQNDVELWADAYKQGILRKADSSYTKAMNKLADGRGNLIGQVEKLKKLGIRTTKSLPKSLLDRVDIDDPLLELAAEAEESNSPE